MVKNVIQKMNNSGIIKLNNEELSNLIECELYGCNNVILMSQAYHYSDGCGYYCCKDHFDYATED